MHNLQLYSKPKVELKIYEGEEDRRMKKYDKPQTSIPKPKPKNTSLNLSRLMMWS